MFSQLLSGAVFLAVAHNIFQSKLLSELAVRAPMEDANTILFAGAEQVRQVVGDGNLTGVLESYNVAITDTFVSLAFLLMLTIPTGRKSY